MYHRHCINLQTRIAIEDGLLDKWVCCGFECMKAYPYDDANLLLGLYQEDLCVVVEPPLLRSKSFTQDMLFPKVIATGTICKLTEANSVFWDNNPTFSKEKFNNKKQACYRNTLTTTSVHAKVF